jgi:acetyl esterase/lipase
MSTILFNKASLMKLQQFIGGLILAMLPTAVLAADDPAAVPLWPSGAPGAKPDGGEMRTRIEKGGERVISNVHQPELFPYVADEASATGCGIVICPGGGHRELWSDHEGHNPARWFRDRGISAFVLLYRLAREAESTYTVDDHALADVQRAIRMVRSRSQEWHVDPQRIGVMGFSAGGEVAALAAMRNDAGQADAADPVDRLSDRPDFQGLIYPGSSSRFTVAKDSPPAFIVCGYGDRPDISRGMAELYLKYKEAGVPAELHIYSNAAHGFGLRSSQSGAVATWPARMEDWLHDIGMVKGK